MDERFDDDVTLIAITKRQQIPCPHYHVQVHNSNNRDRETGLSYPCWAKCNWPRIVPLSHIRARLGQLPDHLSREIADVYDRLLADNTFSDWQ